MPIDDQYVSNLPHIYRDVLAAYPTFDSTRKVGYGLSYQSLYSALEGNTPSARSRPRVSTWRKSTLW